MLPKEKLMRINELANKAKTSKLTKEEAKEQTLLRKEYLETFRASLKKTIENVRVIDEKGNDVTPNKVRMIQQKRKMH